MEKINTALGLRRHMARFKVDENELRFIFPYLPESEKKKFLEMLDNPDVRDLDTFIGWLKIVKAL